MPSTGTIEFAHKGIGAMLAHSRLAVPLNQRDYAWEDEQVRALLQDFANARAKNLTYFLVSVRKVLE